MQFVVKLEGKLLINPVAGEVIDDPDAVAEQHLDRVMEELLEIDARDATVELDMTDGYAVRLSVVVDEANPLEAVQQAGSQIRTAIHAAGGGTPDWPDPSDNAWSVTLVSVNSALVSA